MRISDISEKDIQIMRRSPEVLRSEIRRSMTRGARDPMEANRIGGLIDARIRVLVEIGLAQACARRRREALEKGGGECAVLPFDGTRTASRRRAQPGA